MRKFQKKFKTEKNTKKLQNQKIPKTQVTSPEEETAKMMIKVKMKKVMMKKVMMKKVMIKKVMMKKVMMKEVLMKKVRMKMAMMRMQKVIEKKMKLDQR